MANPIKSAVLRALVEGVLTDLMVRTNAENVTLTDGGTETTLAVKLAEFITALNNKTTMADVNSAISAAVDGLINGAPATYDTLKEIADYIAANEDVVTALNAAIGNKVDKVDGKGLSTNDFTTTLLTKLNGIAAGAQVNVLESVKVNGVAQAISSKAVNITVPTGALANKNLVAETDLETALATKINNASAVNHTHDNKTVLDGIDSTDTAHWDMGYAHSQTAHAPSGAQVNVLESVTVNGVAQAISSKAVNIAMPVIYVQSGVPANLKSGDLLFDVLA